MNKPAIFLSILVFINFLYIIWNLYYIHEFNKNGILSDFAKKVVMHKEIRNIRIALVSLVILTTLLILNLT